MANLSAKTDNSVDLRVAQEKGALEGLIKCIIGDHNSNLQEYATVALANLTITNPIRYTILNREGALNGLVKLLLADNNLEMPKAAARAMANLSRTTASSLKLRIAQEDGALEGLIKCIIGNHESELQGYATTALGNLACTDPIRSTIVNREGALNSLVKLLLADTKLEVQIGAARAMAILSGTTDTFLKLRIAQEDGALEGLIKCIIGKHEFELQHYATAALANLAATMAVQTYFLNTEGALGTLVKLLFVDNNTVQEQAAHVLQKLTAYADNSLKLPIAKEQGAVAGLVKCLALDNPPVLQNRAAWCLRYLAEMEEAKGILEGTEGLLVGLSSLVADGITPETQYIGACALTFINPTKGKEASVTSRQAYEGRADAFIFMRMYAEALADLDVIVEVLQEADARIFRRRCFVKSKLGDLEGALADANEAVNASDSNDDRAFALQERGVLKRMKGDLEGALADLDEGLQLETVDYERLKHRGYVKFLLGDEDGARIDAEWALRIKPPRVDQHSGADACLGVSLVEYMGYKLQ